MLDLSPLAPDCGVGVVCAQGPANPIEPMLGDKDAGDSEIPHGLVQTETEQGTRMAGQLLENGDESGVSAARAAAPV